MSRLPDEAPAATPPRPSSEQPAKPPMIPRSRALLLFFPVLFAVNLLLSFPTGGPADRPRVPYHPFFLEQVEAGNVETITSREDSIEGELKKPVQYDPPGDDEPVEVERFKTQVPAFIDIHAELPPERDQIECRENGVLSFTA